MSKTKKYNPKEITIKQIRSYIYTFAYFALLFSIIWIAKPSFSWPKFNVMLCCIVLTAFMGNMSIKYNSVLLYRIYVFFASFLISVGAFLSSIAVSQMNISVIHILLIGSMLVFAIDIYICHKIWKLYGDILTNTIIDSTGGSIDITRPAFMYAEYQKKKPMSPMQLAFITNSALIVAILIFIATRSMGAYTPSKIAVLILLIPIVFIYFMAVNLYEAIWIIKWQRATSRVMKIKYL